MFCVDEAAAEAIRKAYDEGGELAGVAELRRHFLLVAENPDVRSFVRLIAGWKPLPAGTGRPPSVKLKKDEI